jgi:hypothetical protein
MKSKFLTLLVCVALLSCKEDDPKPTGAEKQGVLLAGKKGQSKVWLISDFKIDGDDFYDPALLCFYDNEYTFFNNADQTFEGSEGDEACVDLGSGEELPDQIESGQWAFSIDGKNLIILSDNFNSGVAIFSYFGGGSTPFPAEVVTLTKDILELSMNYTFEGDSGVITLRFDAK